ncbi:PepSY domain-containing protein [Acidovorax sp. Q11]
MFLFSFLPVAAGHHGKRWRLAACVLFASALAAPPAGASGKDDHDRARQAVQAGQVLPLPTVLERLQREVPGQVLEVELEQESERWIYEIKLLTPVGQLTKVKLDARTAEVLRVKSRDDQRNGR